MTQAKPRRGRPRRSDAASARRRASWALTRLSSVVLMAAFSALVGAVPASAAPVDRAAALEAWLKIQDDTHTPAGWTGDTAACAVGTEAPPSITATLDTVNTLRDFAGVTPVTFDPGLNQKALSAAVMMLAARDLNHYPGPTWPCYTSAGAAGANNSNLYLYSSGAAAMAGYFTDLGHRGPMLDPRLATMGTGSTGESNALYVNGAWAASPNTPPMIAWPPPGNVPWPLIRGVWSASLDVAGTVDASAAQVHVSIAGRALPVSGLVDFGRSTYATSASRLGGLLEWDVTLAEPERDADATINVSIDGVKVNGAPRQFGYTINAMRAEVPAPVRFTATRTADTVTIGWDAAAERGVPVSGYAIAGWDGRFAIAQTVGPSVRELTASYVEPTKTLSVTVTPQSRAGYPPVEVRLDVPPPAAGPPTPTPPLQSLLRPLTGGGPPIRLPATASAPIGTPGSRARIRGRVTLKLIPPGPTRIGSRLAVLTDVRGARRLSFAWRRNGLPMTGATHSTYRLRRADLGAGISCLLTAVGADGVAISRTSAARRIPRS